MVYFSLEFEDHHPSTASPNYYELVYQIVQNLTVDGVGSESCGDGQIAGSRPSSGYSIRIEVLSFRVIPTLVSLLQGGHVSRYFLKRGLISFTRMAWKLWA